MERLEKTKARIPLSVLSSLPGNHCSLNMGLNPPYNKGEKVGVRQTQLTDSA